MAQPINIDGVLYEELGNGQLKVVGYADAPAQGRVFSLPQSSEDARKEQRQSAADARAEAAQRRQEAADARQRAKDEREAREWTATHNPDGSPKPKDAQGAKSESELAAVRAEALDKIRLARSLQSRSANGWFTTGFGASLASAVGGTPAYDVKQDTETLKNAGALTRIMEMAKANGGKNPLTPLSNADFQALSSSLANLDTSQSDEQYQANVERVIGLYTRAYEGAGGTDLEGDLNPSRQRKRGAAPIIGSATGQTPWRGGPARSSIVYGEGGSGGSSTLATGAYKSEPDPTLAGVNARVATMLRAGEPDEAIRAFIAQSRAAADPASVDAALDFRRKNPGYKGGYKVDLETRDVPTTSWNRFSASPTGTGMFAAVDAGLGGTTDEFASALGGGDLAELNARKQAAYAANPKAAFAGQAAGAIGSMTALGALGRTTGMASRVANPQLIGDIAFGAALGAGQSNDNRLLGASLGAVGGAGGHYAGQGLANGVGALVRTRPGMATTNGLRTILGRSPLAGAPRLTPGENTVVNALDRAGLDDVTASLDEAQSLGIPMSLADADPNLRELAGAAVRRSPTASAFAEDTLIPRNRGQYDRFTSAVDQNLGPTANIPQLSADLTAEARASASELYARAYGNPVPGTPELDAVLGTPFGRQALGRARTIAANERRSPHELGFALDADGNVVLNPSPNAALARHLGARAELDEAQQAYRSARQDPGADVARARDRLLAARENLRHAEQELRASPDPAVPANAPAFTTQTLDYVKRGMDDVLEEQRNPITGRLVLDEAGRAQNQVRSQLLDEVDRLNPDFAAARQAYAGPMASREALDRGADAYRLHPDDLGMQVANQSPEHLEQIRLGYRSAMVDHAGRVRDSGNPWDATLGTPVARQRLETLYPDDPAAGRLFRLLEMEKNLQQTTNAILGNSRTARNQIADEAFTASPIAQGAADIGQSLLTGGVPVTTMMRGVTGRGVRDAMKLGVGKRAVAKADEIAPILLETDPAAALARAFDLQAKRRAWETLVDESKPKGLGRILSGVAGQGALVPLNY